MDQVPDKIFFMEGSKLVRPTPEEETEARRQIACGEAQRIHWAPPEKSLSAGIPDKILDYTAEVVSAAIEDATDERYGDRLTKTRARDLAIEGLRQAICYLEKHIADLQQENEAEGA